MISSGLYSPKGGLSFNLGYNAIHIEAINSDKMVINIHAYPRVEGAHDIDTMFTTFEKIDNKLQSSYARASIGSEIYCAKKGDGGKIIIDKIDSVMVDGVMKTDIIGRFSFILYNTKNEKDFIRISDGRFHF